MASSASMLGLTEPTPCGSGSDAKADVKGVGSPALAGTDSFCRASTASHDSGQTNLVSSPSSDASEARSLDESTYKECNEAWEARVKVQFADLLGLPKDDSGGRELVSRMIRMLLLCGYDKEDLHPVLVQALALFDRVLPCLPLNGALMAPLERTAIALLTCFLAHAYILDETCPLKYWQSRIYQDYCSLRDLNLAVMKIMRLLECMLHASPEALDAKRELLAPQ